MPWLNTSTDNEQRQAPCFTVTEQWIQHRAQLGNHVHFSLYHKYVITALNCNNISVYVCVNMGFGDGLDDRGSISSESKAFLITTQRPVLGPIEPSIQRVQDLLSSGVKWRERQADHSVRSIAEVELYLHSSIRLQFRVLNYLGTGTTCSYKL